MARHYVTLGQEHRHVINGLHLDKDCVVTFEASSKEDGREKAWKHFGNKFFTDYHEDIWLDSRLIFFPKGYVNIDTGMHNCNEDAQLILLNNGCRYIATVLNKIQYEDRIVGSSLCCSICMKAAIDSRDIHNI